MTADMLRARAWAAHPGICSIGATGAPHRAVGRFGTTTCIDLGVPHAWGVLATSAEGEPTLDEAAAAQAWLELRGRRHGWRVSVSAASFAASLSPWQALTQVDSTEVFAMPGSAVVEPALPPTSLSIDLRPSYGDVIEAYGGWMADVALARLLVVPTDMAGPERRFIVGSVGGRIAGCASVWWHDGTAYLSAIGVIEGRRGRGYGRALTDAALQLTVSGGPGGQPDVIWLHATNAGAALYARMGFTHVDTELLLGPG